MTTSASSGSPVAEPEARCLALFLLAEEVRFPTDEGYDRTAVELAGALAGGAQVQVHFTRPTSGPPRARTKIQRSVRRMLAVADPRLRRSLRRSRPDFVIYMSRTAASKLALLRCALLKLAARRPVVMLDLQGQSHGVGRRLPGWLRPDRLYMAAPVPAHADGRVRGIELGVDLDRFHPVTAATRRELRARWKVAPDAPVVLHVGHLRHGRNLEALLPLAAHHQVIVAASTRVGAESDDLNRLLCRAGVRVYRGYRPDIHELYQLADCYVFPTLSPGSAVALPLSVLESLACDLPVATTPFGVLRERFANAPGVRFFDSPAELAGAVGDLLAERPPTRSLAESYSWRAIADRLLSDLSG